MIRGAGAARLQTQRRGAELQLLLLFGICLAVCCSAAPVGSFWASAGAVRLGEMEPQSRSVTAPTVSSSGDLVLDSARGSTSAFTTQSGSALVVFASVYGENTVTVTDTAKDAFSTLAKQSQDTPKGDNSLWIFAAFDLAGAKSDVLTTTLSGSSAYSTAVDYVDVTGVGPSPLDYLGTPSNYSTTKNLMSSSAAVQSSPMDLVLGAVSAHATHNWGPNATATTLLDDGHEPVADAPMTGADFETLATPRGTTWINATTDKATTYWMSDALALAPAGAAKSEYALTFSESGLPSGEAWYVTLAGASIGSTGSVVSFDEPNGTYAFTIGPISGFLASPASGTVTVNAGPASQAVSFSADSSDWPTYMGEIARDSNNYQQTTLSTETAPDLTELWTASTHYVQAEPVVLNGAVYVGGTDGDEYSLSAATGTQLWKTFVGQVIQPNCTTSAQGVTSSATVAGGYVYVGGGNTTGNLTNGTANWYALQASTGKIAWNIPIGRINLGYYNWASPLIANGTAYIGVSSRCDMPLVWGGLLQVSLTTHQVTGFFNTTQGDGGIVGSSIWGSPTLDAPNNTVFVATGNPESPAVATYSESVVALNATTLAVLGAWQVPASQAIKDSDFGTTPTYFHLPDGTPMVTAMNKNGYLYAFDATDIDAGPVWEDLVATGTNPANVAPTSFGGGLLYDGSGPAKVGGKNYSGAIRAIYPINGTIKWARGMPGDVYGAPAYSNGVVVATGGTALDVLNSSTGALLWNFTCGQAFNAGASIAEGRIYVGCKEMYAFGFAGTPPASPTGGIPGPTTGRASDQPGEGDPMAPNGVNELSDQLEGVHRPPPADFADSRSPFFAQAAKWF